MCPKMVCIIIVILEALLSVSLSTIVFQSYSFPAPVHNSSQVLPLALPYNSLSLNPGCQPATLMASSPPQLCVSNEMGPLTPTSVQDDDILWTQYLKVASDADTRLVKDWTKVIDVLLVFVR